MTKLRFRFRFAAALVVMAGAMLCLPQVAQAACVRHGRAAGAHHRPVHVTTTTVVHHPTTTAVPVVLIPPIVVFPRGTTTVPPRRVLSIVVSNADPPAVGAVGTDRMLPSTGAGHIGFIALGGLALIMLGLLMRRNPAG